MPPLRDAPNYPLPGMTAPAAFTFLSLVAQGTVLHLAVAVRQLTPGERSQLWLAVMREDVRLRRARAARELVQEWETGVAEPYRQRRREWPRRGWRR